MSSDSGFSSKRKVHLVDGLGISTDNGEKHSVHQPRVFVTQIRLNGAAHLSLALGQIPIVEPTDPSQNPMSNAQPSIEHCHP